MGAVLLLPAFLLAGSGIIHLKNGRYEEAAFPVPSYLSLNVLLPRAAYADAADALRHTNFDDGDSHLSLAEAGFHSGAKPQYVITEAEVGLAHAPASAEGWAFYAEALEYVDPAKAARALDQALTVAPYDFFWAGRRARLAAQLWNYLDINSKNAALRQVQMIWDEPMLRDEILLLLATPDGSKLLTRAYASEPDVIRAINRFVSARRRQLQSEKSQG
jgi:hypothetical protein